jgi:hypothetical protein
MAAPHPNLPAAFVELLLQRPDLLLDHAIAYSRLAKSEFELKRKLWMRQIVAALLAFVAMVLSVAFSGVALMFEMTMPLQAPWFIWLIPLSMLLFAALALRSARSQTTRQESASLAAQFSLDAKALRSFAGRPT